jgi:hypothetical protein
VACRVKDHVPKFAFVHELTAFWTLKEVFFFFVALLVKITRIHFRSVEDSAMTLRGYGETSGDPNASLFQSCEAVAIGICLIRQSSTSPIVYFY